MRSLPFRVWHVGCVLALLAPLGVADAQVAIQVKSGTTWASSIELRTVGPLTFRWRWDGADTPKGVAWQVATVPPTSLAGTIATRSGDLIAGETAMRLAAQTAVKGGVYEEFTVNPEKGWPAKFYVRVRVSTERTSAYSRWITVSVVQRAAVAVNPTCTIQAFKHVAGIISLKPAKTVQITAGEIVDDLAWPEQRVLIRITNRLTSTPVSYRLGLKVTSYGKPVDINTLLKDFSPEWWDPAKVQTTAASTTEKLLIVLRPFPSLVVGGEVKPPKGALNFEASITPVSGAGSNCSFFFTVK